MGHRFAKLVCRVVLEQAQNALERGVDAESKQVGAGIRGYDPDSALDVASRVNVRHTPSGA
jgi:hypothetical protein